MLDTELATRLNQLVSAGILTRWNQGPLGTRSENWCDIVWQDPDGSYDSVHTNWLGVTAFLKGYDLGTASR